MAAASTFAEMKITDQLGRTIALDAPPKRIVSLVPSQTELLASLGLEEEVVGITKFCVHPPHWFAQKTRVGGTKTIHMDRVHALQPDLVLANKEENLKEQVEELANTYPVFVTDVNTLDDAYSMIYSVGRLTGKEETAKDIVQGINQGFSMLRPNATRSVAYLIWKDPYMTVGGDTFIDDMLFYAGFTNVYSNQSRYPAITVDDLVERAPQILLLSSEPYPFKQKHVDELQQYLPKTKIILVDGEMFSWYGSRLLHAPAYFQHLQALLQEG